MSQQTDNRLLDDIELSNRQEHKLSYQIGKAISDSGINQIGESRHDLKSQFAGEFRGSHDINANIGITSYASMDKLQSQMHVLGTYCFAREGCNDLRQIKPEHIGNFLHALVDCGYARNTVQSYAAACNKIAVILDRVNQIDTPRTETWSKAIADCKDEISSCQAKDTNTRAYADPQAIVDNLPTDRMQLAGDMQLHYGLRIADATKIDGSKLDGLTLTVSSSKGGQDLRITLSPEDAQRVRDICGDNKLDLWQSDYRSALQDACAATGQEWTGSHGLRHNYAQDRIHTLVGQGVDYCAAKGIVSEELGHHRSEIIEVYLR